jgi:hypothetical protein
MKLSHSIVLFLLFTPLFNAIAQDTPAVEKNLFKINLLLPGVVYEHGFSTKNTLYSEFSVGFGYNQSDFAGKNWAFYPNINEQLRHYYNLEKRIKKSRRTEGNSGNFYGLNAVYNFESINTNSGFNSSVPSVTIAPVWGFQRTNNHNFNYSFNGGIGYNINQNHSEMVLILNFSIGWVIGK